MQHYRKIVPVLLFPVLMFWCSVPSYATTLPLESVPFYNSAFKNMQFRIRDTSGNNISFTGTFDDSVFGTVFNLDKDYNLSNLFYRVNSDTYAFEYAFNHDVFDYYLTFSVGSARPNIFTASSFGVIGYDVGGTYSDYFCTDLVVLSNSNVSYNGFTVIGKLPENTPTRLSYIRCGGSFFIGAGNVSVEAFLYQVPKNSSSEQVVSIIQAINNQTDSIMNAGSGFGGTSSGISSGNSELNDYISQYTEIEQGMHDKFVETQTALNGDFTGFSWGSLSTCLNWVSDYLQQIYLNSGDFKMMIVLPLLLGIALFLIGRGSVILSNATKSNDEDNDS